MAKSYFYLGDGTAQKAIKAYLGDDSGKAVKIKKIYMGDENGKAVLVYNEHTHSWGTTHAGTSPNYYVSCSCGDISYCEVSTRSIAKSCTTAGHTEGLYCWDHNKWFSGETIPSYGGHNYKYTPVDFKRHTVSCTRSCGLSSYNANHTYSNWGVKSASSTCSGCEKVCEHDWEPNGGTDGTCTTPPTADYLCTKCGNYYQEVGVARGHSQLLGSPGAPDVAATCTSGDIWYYNCDYCGEQQIYNNNKPVSCVPDNGTLILPRCGCKQYRCIWCEQVLSIDATGCTKGHISTII